MRVRVIFLWAWSHWLLWRADFWNAKLERLRREKTTLDRQVEKLKAKVDLLPRHPDSDTLQNL